MVARLGLEPHPEGGWYRRTWTAPDAGPGQRGSGSSILYLMDGTTVSRWHRIDATELWQRVAGDPVELRRWSADATGTTVLGGAGPDAVHQVVVEPGMWQSARSLGTWSLVVCVVVPEFNFDGFELAPQGWEPGGA